MIFAAVEKEEGGFAGVNNLICAQMRNWLAGSVRALVMNVADGDETSEGQFDDLNNAAILLKQQGMLYDPMEIY